MKPLGAERHGAGIGGWGARLLLAVIVLGWSSVAYADPPSDTAVKFTCDHHADKAVVVVDGSAPGQPSELGTFKSELDLNMLPRRKSSVLCRMGAHFIVSVVPLFSDEHPWNDNAAILVNGVVVERTFWNNGDYGIVSVTSEPGLWLTVSVCRKHVDLYASPATEQTACKALSGP